MVLATYPTSLDIDEHYLSMMFYSCAQEEPDTIFRVFPSKEIDERAAVACKSTERSGVRDDYCITALLNPEEEGSAYKEILTKTLQRIISSSGDPLKLKGRYRQILADSYRKIERRGGSRDRSLCPYMYERPVKDDELASYCRVVKKECYLSIYQMPGYPQCPRYIRRQRKNQLSNARRIVRAGIQKILDEYDLQRQETRGRGVGPWTEPVHKILDRIFTVLSVSDETVDYAHSIVEYIGREGLFQGHPRPIIAASIAYMSAKHTGDALPENDIIELVGCSRTSLRRNFRELRTLLDSDSKKFTQQRRIRRTRKQKKAISRAE